MSKKEKPKVCKLCEGKTVVKERVAPYEDRVWKIVSCPACT